MEKTEEERRKFKKTKEVGVTQHKQLLVSYSADGRDVL